MAIQFSEDMLDRMGESQRRQTLEMLKQLDEENKKQEQQQPFFRVILYELYDVDEEHNVDKFYAIKEKDFTTKEDAMEFAEYLEYKQPVEFGKIEIIDNNGELIERYIL